MKKLLFIFVCFSMLLYGCGEHSDNITGSKPAVIGEGSVLIWNGKGVTISIRLQKGQEVPDLNLAPGKGSFIEGQFQVVAITEKGRQLASFSLNHAFDDQKLSFRKMKPFTLQFEDYNGDRNPDFTVGQWGGSNGNYYSIITLDANGFRVLEKNIYSSDHRPSIRYRKIDNDSFVNQYYDQRKGYLDVIHKWQNGQFHVEKPEKAKDVHPAGINND